MPTQEIELIKNQFVSKLSPKKIYLFGSFAEGRETEDSDFVLYHNGRRYHKSRRLDG